MVSVVVLTKNEEKNILECIKTLEWCTEIVIIDDNSTDNTRKLVESLNNKKIRLFKREMQFDFSEQRNFGQKMAKYEWILFIDADERVSPSLEFEILSTINTSIDNIGGYYLKRTDFMWGRQLKFGETGSIQLLRLGKKNVGMWTGKVHERWSMAGKVGLLKNPLLHYPHQSIDEFIKEINFYTDIRAYEYYRKGKKVSFPAILLYPTGKFIKNYILKRGFYDGIPGFLVAVLMSFHSFLVRGKLWQLWRKKEG